MGNLIADGRDLSVFDTIMWRKNKYADSEDSFWISWYEFDTHRPAAPSRHAHARFRKRGI